ncbi:hypothetical protein ACFX50_10145 [Neisseria meningitidis]
MADSMGNLIGWEKTGLVAGKQWITAKDDKVSDVCNANGEMGVIGLYEPFSHGTLTIPGHPNCRCEVVSVSGGELGEFAEKRSFVKRLCSMRGITLSAKAMSMKTAGMN